MRKNLQQFLTDTSQKIGLVVTSLDNFYTQLSTDSVKVVTVRGNKSPTANALFDETAAALQFPWFFGDNWSAYMDSFKEYLSNHLELEIIFFTYFNEICCLQPYNLPILLETISNSIEMVPESGVRVILHLADAREITQIKELFPAATADKLLELIDLPERNI